LFREAYRAKTGLALFPGSLNLVIKEEFSLLNPSLRPKLITMSGDEYGGERDILMLPCVLSSLDDTPAFVWRTTAAEQHSEDRRLLEVLASIPLRQTFGLKDGDRVEVRIGLPGHP
jgi:CTP-dependent riboflavin kinase